MDRPDRRLDAEGGVRVAVSDQGPGIEADKQDVIFEKFRQLDGSVTRDIAGRGWDWRSPRN
jgi:signal transduction histidine kinase